MLTALLAEFRRDALNNFNPAIGRITRKHLLQFGAIQAEMTFQHRTQNRTVVSGDGQIPSFVQAIAAQALPLSINFAPAHLAAQCPHHIAVSVVSASVAFQVLRNFTEKSDFFLTFYRPPNSTTGS
jgi:hypothetical protein